MQGDKDRSEHLDDCKANPCGANDWSRRDFIKGTSASITTAAVIATTGTIHAQKP